MTASQIQNNSGAVDRDLGSDLFLGTREANSGRATAPSTYLQQPGFDLSRPLSAMELTGGGDARAVRVFERGGARSNSGFQDERLQEGLVRSRSAQPALHEGHSTVRPPPGLAATRASTQSERMLFPSSSAASRIQRPASTGVLGSTSQSAAVRPSAKTLMDLIQEDYREDQQEPAYNDNMRQLIDRRSESPAVARSPDYGSLAPQFAESPRPNTHQYRQQHKNNVEGESYQRSLVEAKLLQQQQQLLLQQQQQRQQHLQRFGGRRQSPEELLPSYVQQGHGPQLVPQQQQQVGPHQVYFNGQQQHRVEVQPESLAMNSQAVSSGQTVYLNGPTSSPGSGQTVYVNAPSQQPGYGYTTLQYHTPTGQQTQIIHHQSLQPGIQAHSDQFVSVVPVQGGQQIAYWQADQQQTMRPAVTIVNPQGSPVGGSVPLNRVAHQPHSNERHSAHVYGRQRGPEKGGRGKRNAHSRRGDSKSSNHASSPLLEEFRSSKVRDWTMHQIKGHVAEFCQDQNGSRFIQQRLELGDPSEQEIVMNEFLPSMRRLRNDVFGNYVVQKLLDFGTPEMKADIRETLKGELLQLSLQMYGCRVVQKAFEALPEEDLPGMLQEFHHNVLSCIHDQNGNHVIQKCIEVLNSRANKAEAAGQTERASFLRGEIAFVVEDVLVNTSKLSCHAYGCRVLQRILEHCSEEKKIEVLDEIQKCHQRLLDDQYGNYVIQHVLQFGRPSDRDSILEIIANTGLLGLSRQKFASNVVEKLLKYGNGSQRRAIAREMLKVRIPWCETWLIPSYALTFRSILFLPTDCGRQRSVFRTW